MSFPVLDESMACAIFSDHTAQTQVFARSVARASNPTCVHPASPWVCARVHALDSSWWTQQIKDDSGVYH